MSRPRKYNFVEESDLHTGLMKWRETGIVTPSFAEDILKIAQHLLQHHRFARYQPYMHEEMQSDAYVKTVRNLKNIDERKGKIFTYITCCCWTAFIVYLDKHYKEINFKRKLIKETLESLQSESNLVINSELIKVLQDEIQRYDSDEDWQ